MYGSTHQGKCSLLKETNNKKAAIIEQKARSGNPSDQQSTVQTTTDHVVHQRKRERLQSETGTSSSGAKGDQFHPMRVRPVKQAAQALHANFRQDLLEHSRDARN